MLFVQLLPTLAEGFDKCVLTSRSLYNYVVQHQAHYGITLVRFQNQESTLNRPSLNSTLNSSMGLECREAVTKDNFILKRCIIYPIDGYRGKSQLQFAISSNLLLNHRQQTFCSTMPSFKRPGPHLQQIRQGWTSRQPEIPKERSSQSKDSLQ